MFSDAEVPGGTRDPVLLRRYFDALCLNSAGVVEDKALFDAVGITRSTAGAYERLVMDLRVVDQLPA